MTPRDTCLTLANVTSSTAALRNAGRTSRTAHPSRLRVPREGRTPSHEESHEESHGKSRPPTRRPLRGADDAPVDLARGPDHLARMTSPHIRRIAVYCGSSAGSNPRYISNANILGRVLATRGIGVVYGGAAVGCMGAVADGALAAGGTVIGVLTRSLAAREIAHPQLTSLELVDSMHERKMRMAALSDAVIALPGGFGTCDELFEALTWSQLRIDHKPIGLLDDAGFWQPLLAFLDTAVTAGFLQPQNRALVADASDVDTLLTQLTARHATMSATARSAIQP